MLEMKKKFSRKERRALQEVISFLQKKAVFSARNFDNVLAFELNQQSSKLMKVLFREKKNDKTNQDT